MNRIIPKIGAAIVTITVFLFAVFILTGFSVGQYFVCSFLPLGYIMMSAGFQHESDADRRVSANVGMIIAAVYTVLVLLVYFSQNTYVRLENLTEQADSILFFRPGSLMFCYDLLGYGMMSLSTFFIGLSMKPRKKPDKWLRYLMMIHGVFFLGCFFMPMTGVFSTASDSHGIGGNIALLFWCVYFIPIGILSYRHFRKEK
ncbi:MAG: hypothetical protein K2N72_14305 [Oscillospiraceae bacterium]|nr:hypothetical protein [Oscillospiraceae bacterium]